MIALPSVTILIVRSELSPYSRGREIPIPLCITKSIPVLPAMQIVLEGMAQLSLHKTKPMMFALTTNPLTLTRQGLNSPV